MTKFRKLPVIIDAFDWGNPHSKAPDWFNQAKMIGLIRYLPAVAGLAPALEVATKEGVMTAGVDDWVIMGVAGELYPCKPDIFAKTYEAVPPDEIPPQAEDPGVGSSTNNQANQPKE